MDDHALLRQFAADRSDDAFAALAERHVGLVYAVALRSVGNPHDAEEIAQTVFILLAQKAARLRHGRALPGWLFQTTRLTANNFLRGETHRRRREQEAAMQSNLDHEPGHNDHEDRENREDWDQIAPLLDEAIGRLREKDRLAILLRFYERQSLRDIGLALGASEAAAEKRVRRALEKLRHFLTRHGIASTTAHLSAALITHSAPAAPAGLAKAISAVALTKGTAISTSTLTLIKSTLKIMAWTKAKTVVIVVTAALIAAGTTTVVVKEVQTHRKYPWQREPGYDYSLLGKLPPQVKILNSDSTNYYGAVGFGSRVAGYGVQLQDIISLAYNSPSRIVFNAKIPTNCYDFISNFPNGNDTALQREIKRKFGLVGKLEIRDMDALRLVVKTPNAPGLKLAKNPKGDMQSWPNQDGFQAENYPLSGMARRLEAWLGIPIIDNTGLTNRYDIDLKVSLSSPLIPLDDLAPALAGQLGLELVPTNMPLEVLVVEKAK